MKDLLVFLSCGVYEASLALVCLFLYRRYKVRAEVIRKIIHTATSLCTIPVLYWFSSFPWRCSGPAAFVVINFSLCFLGVGNLLGITDKKRFMGLVYYPFSLLLMVVLNEYGWLSSKSILLGMMALGFGDGLAAVVGTTWGRHPYKVYGKYSKSVEGTLAMVVIVMAFALLANSVSLPVALLVGIASAALENFTPFGLDNLTVPVLTAFFMEALCTL